MDPLRRQQTDAKVLRALTALEKLRELNREFPAQLLSTLLYVAAHKDCHKQAMEEDLDLTTASGSRNTDLLSHSHRLGKEGLGLIIKEPDPSNGRRLQLRLTLEGQCLIDTLKEILYD